MNLPNHLPDFRKFDSGSVGKLFDASFCAMDYGLAVDKAPWGISRFHNVNLHGVGVFLDEGYGRRSVVRTRKHILQDSVADFIVVIPILRHSRMSQSGTVRDCGPGHFRILSTAVPFAGHVAVAGARDKYIELLARIPGAMLREAVPRIDEMSNTPILLRPGAGNIMKKFFELALTEGESLSDANACKFSFTLVSAVAAAVIESSEYGGICTKVQLSSLQQLRNSAQDFILRNLSNPELDCGMIPNHFHVSTRYLRAAFAPNDTVSGFIRESRMQRCRNALRSTDLSSQTVALIASGWGFTDPASFSRIYKARFGLRPGHDRTGKTAA